MQLQPAQALEVETLELIDALPANEPGPGIKVRIQERRAAERVRLVHQQFDGGAGRRFNREARPAHHLFGQLEGQKRLRAPHRVTPARYQVPSRRQNSGGLP